MILLPQNDDPARSSKTLPQLQSLQHLSVRAELLNRTLGTIRTPIQVPWDVDVQETRNPYHLLSVSVMLSEDIQLLYRNTDRSGLSFFGKES